MTDIIKLENKIVEKSKIIACKIEEKNLRKRAFILNIAATTACEYLNSKGINADNQNSLYKISEFVRNFELADIYVGGVRLDIRATFDSSNFSVPKIQEKYDAKPAAYIVLKFDSALKATQVLGFIPADELQTIKTEAEYFIYNTEILKPIDKLKEFVEKTTVKPAIFSSIEHEKVRELAVPFLDAQIAESEKVYFIKHVISCPVCRETFSDMSEFDVIVSQVKNYNELLNDSTLSVFAGNKEEIDSTILGSLATVENAEENYEEEQENESLTDNLQEENEENPEDEENTENLEENQQDSEEDKDAELLEDISEQNSTEEQNTEEAIVLGAIPEILPMGVANIEAKIHENSEINTLESTEETETESISNEDLTDLSEELPALTEIEEVEETAEETEEQKDQDNALANITDSETDSDTLAEEAPLEENIDTLEDIAPLDEEVANLDELSTLEEIETEEEISIVSETSDGNKEQQELAETAIEELDEIDSLEEIKDAETLESDNSEEPILENDSNSIEEPTELEITNEVNNDIDNLENLEIEPLETVESVEEHNELSTLTEETQEENIIPETLENTEDTSIAALTDEEDSDLTGEDTPLSELENLQTDDISDLSENVADIDELESLSEENTDTETEISDNNIQEPDEISSLEAETDITLEKLDISDSLEPIGEIETLEHDSLSDIGELQEIHPQEELEETVENKAPSEERKPFTLSLEGEEENEPTLKEETNDLTETEDEDISTESQYDYDIQNETAEETQEPVELVYEEEEEEEENDNEISENSKEDMSVTDDKEQESDIYGTTEPVDTDKINEEYEENQNTETSTDTDEIQNLLDDDLLALLSDDAEQQNDANENEPQYSQETNNEELISDEVSATVDNNETEHAQASADNPEEDDTIEALFENEEQTNGEQKEFELAQEPVSQKTVNATKKIIVAAVLTLVLAGGGIASWLVNHNKAATENAQNPDEMFMDLQNQKAESDSEGPAISQDINKSMANSFSDKPSAITITKISWQISEKLAQESSVKEYLQTAGKNIQMNLQNDLSNAADVNFNDSIKISVTIAPDNTLKGAQVLESSGSDQIDEIALRSIKNTLKYVSVPKLKDFKSDYFLTLIINF